LGLDPLDTGWVAVAAADADATIATAVPPVVKFVD